MKGVLATLVRVAAGVAFLSGCTDGRQNLYSEYHRISPDGWRFGEEVFFTPVHTDSLCPGRFVIALRHDNTYPYTALTLEVIHTEEGGGEKRDTVEVTLADPFGQWEGSGIGTSFQVTDTLGPTVHPSGTMVRIRHLMRADTLHGINQAGLFFVPSKDNAH